ncbi:rhodanese-like domain-containing protein [Aestuariivivens sediminicola]|uniref:rhodanese-like domain-containing protein n=1 Tax=Aestuariivivens sediminicola TaxID=2913560 RepID=UPI001F579553|nr:rhodanese-like domain-containing protein [Aestuariivivens sediminicola]
MSITYSKELIEQVPARQLNAIIASEKFTIIDVRSPQGIESQGSIPTAINKPMDNLKQDIETRHTNPDSIFNTEGPFLFCCTGGVMSYMAAIHAQEHGVKNVHNLEGGHAAWLKLPEDQD